MSAIEMPYPLPVNASTFDLAYVQDISPVGYGFIQTINRLTPPWVAKYTTPPLTDNLYQALQPFFDALQGASNTFLGFDPRRMRPFAYKHLPLGVTPYQVGATSPQLTAVSQANGTISMTKFTVAAVITSGDYISLQDPTSLIWYLFRAASTGVADGNGNMTIAVYPSIPNSLVANNQNIRLDRACAEMKIIGPITKGDQVSDVGPTYSFSAVQYINRTVQ